MKSDHVLVRRGDVSCLRVDIKKYFVDGFEGFVPSMEKSWLVRARLL